MWTVHAVFFWKVSWVPLHSQDAASPPRMKRLKHNRLKTCVTSFFAHHRRIISVPSQVKGHQLDNKNNGLKWEDMWWCVAALALTDKKRIASWKVFIRWQAVCALSWYRSQVKQGQGKERQWRGRELRERCVWGQSRHRLIIIQTKLMLQSLLQMCYL